MKRGWCPGVHEPMPSGDGLLIRVKPFGGKLAAGALRILADIAADCGNGAVELTGRGSIQLRGLSAATAPNAATALVEAGLADPDPVREAQRNVIAVPPCDDALVAAIEAALAGTTGLAAKFCIAVGHAAAAADVAVVGGRVLVSPLTPALSRVRERESTTSPPRPLTRVRERAGVRVSPPADLIRRLAAAARGRRMRDVPTDELPGGGWAEVPAPPPAPSPALLALPFGQTDAAALRRLAALIGDRTARTTPWRGFFLPGPYDPAPFAAAGFITDPNDPRRGITACAGAPACASASVPARTDAAFLAARGLRGIHVSGCAKGCAHPGAATTLVGTAGPSGNPSGGLYSLVRDGRAADPPSATGLTIAEAAAMLA